MPDNKPNIRKTFAIISHPDAGKTTLTEKLLLFGGAIQQAGAVKARGENRRARSDWMKVEQERGISVASSVMTFDYKNITFNLLDTPGHEDFSEDTYRVLTAVDSAIMVLDSAKGIETQTKKLFEVCRLRDVPIITFINKLDREGQDPFCLLDEIEKTLALEVTPASWPIGMGKDFLGCYDLINDQLILMNKTGDKSTINATIETCKGLDDPKLDDFLCMGPKAMFIEDPKDQSNRPRDLKVTIKDLGPELEKLFIRAFVDGLHDPNERPTAMEWEKALVKTWDLLYPCENPKCGAKWFVLHNPANPVCPFCGRRVAKENIVRLHLKSQVRGRQGQWIPAGEVNLYNNMPLFRWHLFSNCFPDEKTDRKMLAYVVKYQGQWLLVNHDVRGMISPGGSLVPTGQAILLKDGAVFRASSESKGLLIEVSCGR